MISVSTLVAQALDARLGLACARCVPSNENGLVTTPTVSAPSSRGELGDDRRGAGAGAAAHRRR